MQNLNFFEQEEHKPFFHRTSTWIVIVGIIVSALVGSFIYDGLSWTKWFFRTEVVEADIVNTLIEERIEIYKWTAERRYGRGSVPDCAWDVNKDTYYVCDTRDTLGSCISGHYETDYDYNVMDWVHFKTEKNNYWNSSAAPQKIHVAFWGKKKFRLEFRYSKSIFVSKDGSTKRLSVNELPKNKTVKIVRRKRNKNILRLQ